MGEGAHSGSRQMLWMADVAIEAAERPMFQADIETGSEDGQATHAPRWLLP
jgi:hypothetical protein